jgi:hypothetical protein
MRSRRGRRRVAVIVNVALNADTLPTHSPPRYNLKRLTLALQ